MYPDSEESRLKVLTTQARILMVLDKGSLSIETVDDLIECLRREFSVEPISSDDIFGILQRAVARDCDDKTLSVIAAYAAIYRYEGSDASFLAHSLNADGTLKPYKVPSYHVDDTNMPLNQALDLVYQDTDEWDRCSEIMREYYQSKYG